MSTPLAEVRESLKKDKSGNYLILVLGIIIACIWGSFMLQTKFIGENKVEIKELQKNYHTLDKAVASHHGT